MAKQEITKKSKMSDKEPVFIVRPVNKNFGLDYLHIMLIALVIILIAVAFALSTFKPGTLIVSGCSGANSTNSTCNATSIHTSAQALSAASRYLAAYSNVNTSLQLIPYYALINQSKVSYLAQGKEWLVTVPYKDPYIANTVFNISLLMYDSNLTLATSFLQTLKPQILTNNTVVALGTVNIYGEAACKTSTPIPIYVVTDPYAPGALNAINTTIAASKAYGDKINATYYILFSGASQQYYNSFGVPQTQLLGQYMECASRQPAAFPAFISNLSTAYTGRPLSNETLFEIEEGSALNRTEFSGCMDNVSTILNIQSQFASLYHIISTPTVIVNCRYSTIPQTLNYAINYSLNNLNG